MLPVRWRPRELPLPARGLVVRGPGARALGQRLLAWSDARLLPLRACVGGDGLVLLGDEAALPWSDGACYLGQDPAAPAWLLPTNRSPDVPISIFAEALAARLPGGPWAIVPGAEGLSAFTLAAAAPIARSRLQAWLERP